MVETSCCMVSALMTPPTTICTRVVWLTGCVLWLGLWHLQRCLCPSIKTFTARLINLHRNCKYIATLVLQHPPLLPLHTKSNNFIDLIIVQLVLAQAQRWNYGHCMRSIAPLHRAWQVHKEGREGIERQEIVFYLVPLASIIVLWLQGLQNMWRFQLYHCK